MGGGADPSGGSGGRSWANAPPGAPMKPIMSAVTATARWNIPPPLGDDKPLEPHKEITDDQGTFKTITLKIG
jgi:hypothetical protein